jgi:cysteine synthase B
VPPILGQGLTDVKTRVGIEPTAAMCRRLAERGLFVGPSSGAYVHAALEIAAGGRFPTIATVISDIGECCASTGMRGGGHPSRRRRVHSGVVISRCGQCRLGVSK